MKKGKLKFYNSIQETGLVIDFETGKEYKVRSENLTSPLIKGGDNVIFEIANGKDGLNAVNVRPDIFKLN